MRHATKLLTAAALALALVGAGCSESEYIARYDEATAPLVRLSTEMDAGTPSANGCAQMAAAFHDARVRLDAFDAPSSAQDELDRTLAAIDATSERVRTLRDAVRSGDADRITTATRAYASTGSDLLQAEATLRFAVGA